MNLFNGEKAQFYTIGEFCDIGNGLVSGLDKAFQVGVVLLSDILNEVEKEATLNVIKAKDLKPFFAENITKIYFHWQRTRRSNVHEGVP